MKIPLFALHLLLAAFASTTSATTILFDNFDDGDLGDGSPTSWEFGTGVPFGADVDASSGDAVFAVGSNNRGILSPFDVVGDVSVRTQYRITAGAEFGIVTKWTAPPVGTLNDGYFLQTDADDIGDDNLFISSRVGTVTQPPELDSDFAMIPPDNGVDRDVILQMDVVGNRITGWLWEAGGPLPTAPLVTRTLDETLQAGQVGVYANGGTATVRFIQIANAPIPVPEPASSCLALIAAATVVSLRHLAKISDPDTTQPRETP